MLQRTEGSDILPSNMVDGVLAVGMLDNGTECMGNQMLAWMGREGEWPTMFMSSVVSTEQGMDRIVIELLSLTLSLFPILNDTLLSYHQLYLRSLLCFKNIQHNCELNPFASNCQCHIQ